MWKEKRVEFPTLLAGNVFIKVITLPLLWKQNQKKKKNLVLPPGLNQSGLKLDHVTFWRSNWYNK